MKFKKLELWNITSLRGHHIVDFEKLTTGDDLFAITGPTGSGKSSLLSAISFSLFNKHYKGIRPQDIISHGESESKIILTFSIHANTYEAHWSLRVRTKKGELLKNIPTATHEFYQNGELLSKSVEDIIGLTFDQFNRSVILNQGEFSRFLLSPFTERRKILEEMYGGEDLTLLNTVLKNKRKQIEDNIGKKKHTLDNALPFTEIEAQEKEKAFTQLVESLNKSKNLMINLKKSKDSINNILKLIKDKIDTKANEQKLSADREKALKDKNLLKEQVTNAKTKLNESVQIKKSLSPHIEAYNKEEINLKNSHEKIKDLERRQEVINQKLKSSEEEKVKIQASLVSKKELTTPSKDQKTLTEQIELLKKDRNTGNELILLLQKIENNRTDTSIKQSDLKKLEDKGKDVANEITSLETRMKALESADTNQLEVSQTLHEKLTVLESDWLKYQRNQNEDEKLLSTLSQDFKNIEVKFQESTKKYESLNNRLKLTLENKELKLRLIHLNHFIEEARHSHECPVCHNKGDFKELHTETLNDSGLDSIDALTKEKEQAQIELNAIQVKREGIKNETSRLTDKISKEKERMSKELQDHGIENNPLSTLEKIQEKIESLKSIIKEFRDKTQELGLIQNDLKRSITNRDQLRKDYLEAKNILTSKEKEYEILNGNYEGLIKSIVRAPSEFNFQALSTWKQNLEKEEQKLSLELQVIRDIAHLEESLKALDKNLLENSTELSEIKKQFSETNLAKTTIESNLDSLSKKIRELVPNAQNFSDYLKELDYKIQKDEEALEVKSKEARDLDLEFNTLETKIENHKEKISKIDLLLVDEGTVLKKELELSTDQLKDRPTFSQETTKLIKSSPLVKNNEKSELILEGLTHYLDYTFIPFFEEFEAEIKESNESSIKLKSELELFRQKKDQADLWRQEIKEGLVLLERYRNLSDAIGGNEFRDFALTVIENELLKLTNHELETLCDGRYRLESKDANTGQEFMVNDSFQAGAKRKVTTLSGGETFLVSLAMALGLSEMTRGNTEIESFFIDEGFGSLDHDSINEVIDVLMNVRNRGKQIGVISHVRALTDRLPISLRLHKNQLGDGNLSIETSY